jgi:4-alpha-glucanotransferase
MQAKIDRALEILGIRNFLLGIHDPAFPSLPEEDLGRGSPYSAGAADFLKFARSLGFNGIQLGPQGITTPENSSPYDGTFFSRNPLSLAPLTLIRPDCNLLTPETLARFTTKITGQLHPDSTRVHDSFSRQAICCIAVEICTRYRRGIREGESASCTSLRDSYAIFRRQNAAWLERDALYEILKQCYGGRNWKQWAGSKEAKLDRHLFGPPPGREAQARLRLEALYRQHSEVVEDYCFIQFQLAAQHRELRDRCRHLGLKLFGDCQIGFSGRDAWYAQSFLLSNYVMGAPPSRTNPEGQPWNYPVLDPQQYFVNDTKGYRQPGPAARFLRERVEKLLDEFDGLRLDHPHGLVCPWVYMAGQDDPFNAVQEGARLFASPALADHPELAKFAIVRQDQLNKQVQRYDDGWVASLDPAQVRRYAQLFEVIIETARKKWCGACEIACEILSTQPYPVKRVMELYGLGRFRVTQKADLNNELDVYRSENAQPEDWLMLGNHDTAPIWQVADKWFEDGISRRHADYLAMRLNFPAAERTRWAERIAADPGALIQAKFADLFVGPAQNIMVFFTDLLGSKQTYNKPGTVSGDNWTLRIPSDYKRIYTEKLTANNALNIPKALAMALRSRGHSTGLEHRELIRELE